MHFNAHAVVLATLSLTPTLIAAHGKVAAVVGDAGGNGTAIGIQGGVVPGPGKNRVTEVDTTVFGQTNVATDGLGKTNSQGKNTVAMVAATMDQSGATLPQVSNGGSISGTFHVVTTDGAGPVQAMIDTTGTGAFSSGVMANVVTGMFSRPASLPLFEKPKYSRGVQMCLETRATSSPAAKCPAASRTWPFAPAT